MVLGIERKPMENSPVVAGKELSGCGREGSRAGGALTKRCVSRTPAEDEGHQSVGELLQQWTREGTGDISVLIVTSAADWAQQAFSCQAGLTRGRLWNSLVSRYTPGRGS